MADLSATATGRLVQNQPHDEEVALSEGSAEDVLMASSDTRGLGGGTEDSRDDLGAPPPHEITDSLNEYDDDGSPSPAAPPARGGRGGPGYGDRDPIPALGTAPPGGAGGSRGNSGQQGRSGMAPSLDGSPDQPAGPVQEYRPEDYAHVMERVSPAVRELLGLITRYKPQNITLETSLRPFIPEYIPALGEIDEFVKVPRPDGRADYLGMKVLDEPALKQSDRALLTLQLKNLARAPAAHANESVTVEAVDDSDAASLARRLSAWVSSVEDLHRQRPPQEVTYSKNMPDIEALMQEWPPEVEQALRPRMGQLPGPHTPMPTSAMAKSLCALLDIPVHYNLVESLHLMFSVYLEMRNINPMLGGGDGGGAAPGLSPLSLSQSGPFGGK